MDFQNSGIYINGTYYFPLSNHSPPNSPHDHISHNLYKCGYVMPQADGVSCSPLHPPNMAYPSDCLCQNLAVQFQNMPFCQTPLKSERNYATSADSAESKKSSLDQNYILPGEELQRLLVQRIEYFFSTEYIFKNTFMLKHILRNKDGYVNLKLINALRKVKKLSEDSRDIVYSIKNKSRNLILSSDNTKIKKKVYTKWSQLPKFETNIFIVYDFGESERDIDNLKACINKVFHFGGITLKLFKARENLPNELFNFFYQIYFMPIPTIMIIACESSDNVFDEKLNDLSSISHFKSLLLPKILHKSVFNNCDNIAESGGKDFRRRAHTTPSKFEPVANGLRNQKRVNSFTQSKLLTYHSPVFSPLISPRNFFGVDVQNKITSPFQKNVFVFPQVYKKSTPSDEFKNSERYSSVKNSHVTLMRQPRAPDTNFDKNFNWDAKKA